MKTKVRLMGKFDVEGVLEAEAASCSYWDEDSGQIKSHPWRLTEAGLMALVRQTATSERAAVKVCVVDEADEDGGRVAGAFAYELGHDGYTVVWLVARPDLVAADVIRPMVDYLQKKADAHKRRKKIRVFLRDSDEARLREYLPPWSSAGFRPSLSPGLFGDTDGWELCWESQTEAGRGGDEGEGVCA